jgi:DNA-binding PadR family transcriptional regulator
MLLLAVLERGPAHGYALITELRQRSGATFDLPEGTVYPALHRLEREGLVSSRWDHSTARRRRIYEITAPGVRSLAAQRRDWHEIARAVTAVLGAPA